MPNPLPPTPSALGSWILCSDFYDLPKWAGIYRFQSKKNSKWGTRYVGYTENLRTRVTNHEKFRGGDRIHYKRVPYFGRKYYDPVSNKNTERLNMAEKLHFADEVNRGQQCRRNSDLFSWLKKYNALPKSEQKINLAYTTKANSSTSRQRKQPSGKVDYCKFRPRKNSPRCGYHRRRHGSEYSNNNRCGFIRKK